MSEATDGQLDPGVFQQLLQPLVSRPRSRVDRGAGAGQVPQRRIGAGGTNEPGHQPVLAELSQPGRVRHVGLAAGQGLDMRGVEQQACEPGRSSSR